MECPPKEQWKKVIKGIITETQERKWKRQLSEKKTMKYFFSGDYSLNGKISKLVNFHTSPREVAAARCNVKMLLDEIESETNLARTGRGGEGMCIYCKDKYYLI